MTMMIGDREYDLFDKASEMLLAVANNDPDPMSTFQAFKSYNRNGLSATISCHHSKDLDTETRDWVFDITERNMKHMYESCQWGWDAKVKRAELFEEEARYLIIRDTETNAPLGYSHFRFDLDDEREVLYCYEVQLVDSVRRKGLGRFLVQILELLANKFDVMKVVLTVFRHNHAAVNFFQTKMKYTLDDTSPNNTFYTILSKPTLKWRKIGQASRK